MLRLFLTPKWLGWLALAVLATLVCTWLGQWQWSRYEDKAARADRIEAHYGADPVPVTDVLTRQPVATERQWTKVTATGEYLPDEQLLVRNRPLEGTYGYEVLVPLRLAGGERLVVDRGWVPNSPKGADVTPPVPPPPTGTVTVTGWVQQSEPDLGRDMPAGQVASIHLPEVADRVGGPVLGGYVALDTEDPQVERPAPLEEPDTGTGPHLAYAIQWWLVGPAALVFYVMALRREAGAGTPRAPREKKVRIWDEEDG